MSRLRPHLLGASGALILGLAPLKFGNFVGIAEASMFPGSPFEWLILPTWPPALLTLLCLLYLVLVLAIVPAVPGRSREWLLPASWAGLCVACLPGLVHTRELDYAYQFLTALLAVTCFAVAAFCAVKDDARAGRWLLAGIVFGTVVAAVIGLQQRCGGFARALAYAEELAQAAGREVPQDLRNRLAQNRVFGPFVYPNTLAAHLLLTTPLAVYAAWRLGHRFHPPRLSAGLLGGGCGLLLLAVLTLTGSRAAFVAAAGGIGVGILLAERFRAYRIWLILAAVVCSAAFFAVVSRGRTLTSVEARVHCWSAAVSMTRAHPFAGSGLGEFANEYVRLKEPGKMTSELVIKEDPQLPHCMTLNLAAHAGLGAALMGLLCVGLPIALLALAGGRPPASRTAAWCGAVGVACWALHAQAEFNVNVPGTLVTVAALPILTLLPKQASETTSASLRLIPARRLLGVLPLLVLIVGGLVRLRAEQALAKLERACSNGTVSLRRLEDLTQDAARFMPYACSPWIHLADAAAQRDTHRGHTVAARALQEAALRAPHRALLHAKRARQLMALGDAQGAARSIDHALSRYPTSTEYRAIRQQLQQTRSAPP